MTHGLKNGTMRARVDSARGVIDGAPQPGLSFSLIEDAPFGAVRGGSANMFIATDQLPSLFLGMLNEAICDGKTDEIMSTLLGAVDTAVHDIAQLKEREENTVAAREWYAATHPRARSWDMLDADSIDTMIEQFIRQRDFWNPDRDPSNIKDNR